MRTRAAIDDVTIGIDIGTTSVKAVAADADGRVLGRARVPHGLRQPRPGTMEHDAVGAWQQGPLRALQAVGQPDAVAVAVASIVPSMTAVSADGRPVSEGLLYGDSRGRGGATRSDLDPSHSGELVEMLRWTAAQYPQARGYWPAGAVANYALAGQPVVDIGTAFTATPLFGWDGWDRDACTAAGVSVDQLPVVKVMGEPIGELWTAARCAEGAGGPATRRAPLVGTGSVDAVCEQMVAGADQPGDVLVVCGTTLVVWVTQAGWRTVDGLWTVPHLCPGNSVIGGPSNAGGLFVDWVDRTFAHGDPDSLRPGSVPVWAPFLRGERVPLHDPGRRAILWGLDASHDPAAIRRAAFEASGFVVRHIVERSGVSPGRIVATGGGTRQPAWMQALADATGLVVEVASVPDGAALGASFLARMAAGLETSMNDAARWARCGRTVEPAPGWAGAVQDRYGAFLELLGPA